MPSKGDVEDRRIAAMLLCDARVRAERASEVGHAAYFEACRPAPRVDEGLLRGEISQARSHNKRCGVDAGTLPTPERTFASKADRRASQLDVEFLRQAHALRAQCASSRGLASNPRKRLRSRAGAGDEELVAAAEEEAKQAEEEVALADPLLRPPPSASGSKCARATSRQPAVLEAGSAGGCTKASWRGADLGAHSDLWPSRKLRVRVVDAHGQYKGSHLQKGVVRRVDSTNLTVDLELDQGGGFLQGIPQECLETVVSKTCTCVEIVRGPHRGVLAELVHRDPRRNIAVVRLGRAFEDTELRLPMDDICEFA